ncbi:alpha/beta fold hydrolase [archaeon]|nr:MAG: alpha/beta fold hydrolase [archaeon]
MCVHRAGRRHAALYPRVDAVYVADVERGDKAERHSLCVPPPRAPSRHRRLSARARRRTSSPYNNAHSYCLQSIAHTMYFPQHVVLRRAVAPLARCGTSGGRRNYLSVTRAIHQPCAPHSCERSARPTVAALHSLPCVQPFQRGFATSQAAAEPVVVRFAGKDHLPSAPSDPQRTRLLLPLAWNDSTPTPLVRKRSAAAGLNSVGAAGADTSATANVVVTREGPLDAPLVVCIHGAPGSTYDWRWFAPALTPHVQVLRLELPGHGESERAAVASLRFEDMSSAVWRIVDAAAAHFAIPPAVMHAGVHLVGHSMGSHVSLYAAAQRLHAVSSLTLVAPVGLRPHRALRPWWLATGMTRALATSAWLRPALREYLHVLYVRVFHFPKRLATDEIEWCQLRVGAFDFEAARERARSVAAARLPVLIASADDDHLVEPAITHELASVLNARMHMHFQTGGHNLQKHQASPIGDEMLRSMIPTTVQQREAAASPATPPLQ